MFFLPQYIISKIYEYDNTYHLIYSNCIKQFYYQYYYKPTEILELIKIQENYNKKRKL